MTKHSKNNTASSIFSYAEYKKLDYGTKRQRLGNESMRPFDACTLCLQQARDPVACPQGHVFCKECVYTDLLSQKKAIKQQKERIEALRTVEETSKQSTATAARERVLREFVRDQIGLGSTSNKHQGSRSTIDADSSESRGIKRKFEFDKEAVEAATRQAEAAALKQLEIERAESEKAKLPDFWLPSLTPAAKAAIADIKDIKLQTMCHAGEPKHPLSAKHLIPVTFTSDNSANAQSESRICPSCKKSFSNHTLIFLMKPCSHTVCKTCFETLVTPSRQCIVCDVPVQEKESIQLNREGTGYAGGGRAETSKVGVAFQG